MSDRSVTDHLHHGRVGFDADHEAFRDSLTTFLEREVLPGFSHYEASQRVPRELFARAGRYGFLGMQVPEAFGGAGIVDFRFNAIVAEQTQRLGVGGFGLGLSVHTDICLPYLLHYATPAQQERWLPGLGTGDLICAIAMTEPGAGSDLAGIATRARRTDAGYVLNGSKTFISNGVNADVVIVVARTGGSGNAGLSLLVLDRDTPGFTRGRPLEKLGQHAQDTVELFFDDAEVPQDHLLGAENAGFGYLVANLPQERLAIAATALAAAEAAVAATVVHVRERRAFGAPLGALQNTRFVLAELHSEVEIGWSFVDACIDELNAGRLTAQRAAMAKWWCTELQGRAVDRCLQLHGGYGYMVEAPIARAYVDARITRIYGGANEVLKDLVGRSMRLA